jgi:hypothetical protein
MRYFLLNTFEHNNNYYDYLRYAKVLDENDRDEMK